MRLSCCVKPFLIDRKIMNTQNFLAIDLGAESGRAILGKLDDDRLDLSEVHRFPNLPIWAEGQMDHPTLYWDTLQLWQNVKDGIARIVRSPDTPLAGVGIDTWGVDFGLLDRNGDLVANPIHYRDSRTDGMFVEAFQRMSREEIFERTGLQFLELNTLFQLLSLSASHSPSLEIAETLLTMPNLMNFWLTGEIACEFTNATTTQCYDPRMEEWSGPLLEAMEIPLRIFPKIIQPGTMLGNIRPSVAGEIGGTVPVIAPATHDTGSAVAAVPAKSSGFAWISSGTWSVMGTEINQPIINEASLENNFTNEGGVNRTFRFSKNIAGLWLLQECRRTWASQGEELSYDDLTALARSAEPFTAVIDADDGSFVKPGDMPARISEYCQRTGQKVPASKGAFARSILEAIALKYRRVLDRLEQMTGQTLEPIYIVGGGTRNQLLSQFAAEATGRQVITGPVEATAVGNILVQAVACGTLSSIHEARQVVSQSFEVAEFDPGDRAPWDEAFEKLNTLMSGI
jgi:rhamnulokinase